MYEATDADMDTSPTYLKGDIVWVKLSGCWWPGEVKAEEELPSGLLADFKKPPLVIVKFFDEDSYEYIKQWSTIYPYNCVRKNDFIKRGMAAYRAKQPHMAKFPKDIFTAEEKTNGDPNILSQPEFLPPKKLNYDEIFGTPNSKKSSKNKPSTSLKKTITTDSSLVTHRRFIGNDDYKSYIWVQYPGKDREPDSEDDEIKKLDEEPEEVFTCKGCSFKTRNMGVLLIHTKLHLEGHLQVNKRRNKKPKLEGDSEVEPTKIKTPKPKQEKKKQENKKSDNFTDLLCEWDDSDEEASEVVKNTPKPKKHGVDKNGSKSGSRVANDKKPKKSSNNAPGLPLKNTQDDIKNCFDFDEEDEEEDILLPTSSGRKIPRVIPEKPKTSISELLELSDREEAISNEKAPESNENIKSPEPPKVDESLETSFKELMDETEVPVLEDLAQSLKPEQNFHDARTVKFPDKGGTALNREGAGDFESTEDNGKIIEDEPNKEPEESTDGSPKFAGKDSILMDDSQKPANSVTSGADKRKSRRFQTDIKEEGTPLKNRRRTRHAATVRDDQTKREIVEEIVASVEANKTEAGEADDAKSEVDKTENVIIAEKPINRRGRPKAGMPRTSEEDCNSVPVSKTLEVSENIQNDSIDNQVIVEVPEKPTPRRGRSKKEIQIVEAELANEESNKATQKEAETLAEPERNEHVTGERQIDEEKHQLKSRKSNKSLAVKQSSASVEENTITPIPENIPVDTKSEEAFSRTRSRRTIGKTKPDEKEPETRESEPVTPKDAHSSSEAPAQEKSHEEETEKLTTKNKRGSKQIVAKMSDCQAELTPIESLNKSSRRTRSKADKASTQGGPETVEDSRTPLSVTESSKAALDALISKNRKGKSKEANLKQVFEPEVHVSPSFERRRGRSRKETKLEEEEAIQTTDNDVRMESEAARVKDTVPELKVKSPSEDEHAEGQPDVKEVQEEVGQETEKEQEPVSSAVKVHRGRPRKSSKTTEFSEPPTEVVAQVESSESKSDSKPCRRGRSAGKAKQAPEETPSEEPKLDSVAVTGVIIDTHYSSKSKTKRAKSKELPSRWDVKESDGASGNGKKEETEDTNKKSTPDCEHLLKVESSLKPDDFKSEAASEEKEPQLDNETVINSLEISNKTLEEATSCENMPTTEDAKKLANEDSSTIEKWPEGEDVLKDVSKPQDIEQEPESSAIKMHLESPRKPATMADVSEPPAEIVTEEKVPDQPKETIETKGEKQPEAEDASEAPLSAIQPEAQPECSPENDKSVPPKKNKWSRMDPETELPPPPGKAVDTPSENELILPLKKSKRANEVGNQLMNDNFDTPFPDSDAVNRAFETDGVNFSLGEESFLSASMRNNIENLINDISVVSNETVVPSSNELSLDFLGDDAEQSKGVPPKKKKLDQLPVTANHQTVQPDDNPTDISHAPKKKMQKLFEISQVQQEKAIELPQMSPLAKKKSFQFHQEDFHQTEGEQQQQQQQQLEESSVNKRKLSQDSTSEDASPAKKEKLELPTELSSAEEEPKSAEHMEVKIGTDDELKFNIKTNLSNIATSKAEELCSKASETLAEIQQEAADLQQQKAADLQQQKASEAESPPQSTISKVVPEVQPVTVAPTVISEKELADVQVEITAETVTNEKKLSFHVLPKSDSKILAASVPQVPQARVAEPPTIVKPSSHVVKSSELLDILEGNSNSSTNSSGSEQKFKTSFDRYEQKKTTVEGIIDFEEAIPSQIVLTSKADPNNVLLDSPKLLERLSMPTDGSSKAKSTRVAGQDNLPSVMANRVKPGQKIIIKTTKPAATTSDVVCPKPSSGKPIILSEQIIRPANTVTPVKPPPVAVQGTKRQYEDVEDIETAFIIPKIQKKAPVNETTAVAAQLPDKAIAKSRPAKSGGKAKILQQTIITSRGEIIPQTTSVAGTSAKTVQIQPGQDDSVFDINSMPIVLSDELLTPESIQNMPVMLSDDVVSQQGATVAKKIVASTVGAKQIIFKPSQSVATAGPVAGKPPTKVKMVPTTVDAAQSKMGKVGTTAILATGTTPDGKPAKYVLVPPPGTPATAQIKPATAKTVIKKPVITKVALGGATALSAAANQMGGNKIMIVTNAQGQQTRVVLTPQQQKAFMQATPGGKTKTIFKSNLPKGFLETAAGPSGVTTKAVTPVVSQAVSAVSVHSGLLMPAVKNVKAPTAVKKVAQKPVAKTQKTILIKNQLGQTVKKIQGTDDADLDRQVAEQLKAIKASARQQQANKQPEIINYTNRQIPATNKTPAKKPVSKKVEVIKAKTAVTSQSQQEVAAGGASVPPLVASQRTGVQLAQTTPQKLGMVGRKTDQAVVGKQQSVATKQQPSTSKEGDGKRSDSPVRQVVIQDGLGNLTTVTVGQILAIPSETVDGQPQSYMLVTVDESGNLTPLNNDALMSLDPSLGAGGDINNVVLQVDQSQGVTMSTKTTIDAGAPTKLAETKPRVDERPKPALSTAPLMKDQPKPQAPALPVEQQQQIVGEGVAPAGDVGGQQFIITGDPIATQKFLESLSDGSTDLGSLLVNAEGGSVLLQTEGQQILIRTNNQTTQSSLLGLSDIPERVGNPMLSAHKPNQDILAAALANTDVFQADAQQPISSATLKGLPAASQLSPGGGVLYPMPVSNVLETSLTLSSPIMTPLEVPSTNSKKIDDQVDILNQVPKNVDLPITITDPNISQTVAHQPASALMELTLPISETGPGTDINSPSYSYSLPSIEDAVGISQKSFSSSMPLLSEDVVEGETSNSSNSERPRTRTSLESIPAFSPNYGSLPAFSESGDSSQDEVIKTQNFGDIGSLPMLSDDDDDIGGRRSRKSSRRSSKSDIGDEGLSTLGGQMCSSLSEPPPDMFDLSAITATRNTHKEEEIASDASSVPEPETLSLNSENSGEIPLQAPIVANLNELKRAADDSGDGSDEKRARFDN